ncbi:hypothetical protein KFE25_011078 [Diacronema lutheri]|uniref:non-specific serine/threonine protein kinase n=1 Tax=Diacronema lutheri TaxID=2081491 RepID=A0A8J6C498_DIALT|nr:hypothetical protein KFE25_011078 [Diacronema lutheri]
MDHRDAVLREELRKQYRMLDAPDKRQRRDGLKALPELLAVTGMCDLIGSASTPVAWGPLVLAACRALRELDKLAPPFVKGFAELVHEAHRRAARLGSVAADAVLTLCALIEAHAAAARADAKAADALRTLLGALEALLSLPDCFSSALVSQTRQVATDVAVAIKALLEPGAPADGEDDEGALGAGLGGQLAAGVAEPGGMGGLGTERPLCALYAMLVHAPAALPHGETARLVELLSRLIGYERPRKPQAPTHAAGAAEASASGASLAPQVLLAWRCLGVLQARHGADALSACTPLGENATMLLCARRAWTSCDAALMAAALGFVRWQLGARATLLCAPPPALAALRDHMASCAEDAAGAHGALLPAGILLHRTHATERDANQLAHARARAYLCFVAESAAAAADEADTHTDEGAADGAEGGADAGGADAGRARKRARTAPRGAAGGRGSCWEELRLQLAASAVARGGAAQLSTARQRSRLQPLLLLAAQLEGAPRLPAPAARLTASLLPTLCAHVHPVGEEAACIALVCICVLAHRERARKRREAAVAERTRRTDAGARSPERDDDDDGGGGGGNDGAGARAEAEAEAEAAAAIEWEAAVEVLLQLPASPTAPYAELRFEALRAIGCCSQLVSSRAASRVLRGSAQHLLHACVQAGGGGGLGSGTGGTGPFGAPSQQLGAPAPAHADASAVARGWLVLVHESALLLPPAAFAHAVLLRAELPALQRWLVGDGAVGAHSVAACSVLWLARARGGEARRFASNGARALGGARRARVLAATRGVLARLAGGAGGGAACTELLTRPPLLPPELAAAARRWRRGARQADAGGTAGAACAERVRARAAGLREWDGWADEADDAGLGTDEDASALRTLRMLLVLGDADGGDERGARGTAARHGQCGGEGRGGRGDDGDGDGDGDDSCASDTDGGDECASSLDDDAVCADTNIAAAAATLSGGDDGDDDSDGDGAMGQGTSRACGPLGLPHASSGERRSARVLAAPLGCALGLGVTVMHELRRWSALSRRAHTGGRYNGQPPPQLLHVALVAAQLVAARLPATAPTALDLALGTAIDELTGALETCLPHSDVGAPFLLTRALLPPAAAGAAAAASARRGARALAPPYALAAAAGPTGMALLNRLASGLAHAVLARYAALGFAVAATGGSSGACGRSRARSRACAGGVALGGGAAGMDELDAEFESATLPRALGALGGRGGGATCGVLGDGGGGRRGLGGGADAASGVLGLQLGVLGGGGGGSCSRDGSEAIVQLRHLCAALCELLPICLAAMPRSAADAAAAAGGASSGGGGGSAERSAGVATLRQQLWRVVDGAAAVATRSATAGAARGHAVAHAGAGGWVEGELLRTVLPLLHLFALERPSGRAGGSSGSRASGALRVALALARGSDCASRWATALQLGRAACAAARPAAPRRLVRAAMRILQGAVAWTSHVTPDGEADAGAASEEDGQRCAHAWLRCEIVRASAAILPRLTAEPPVGALVDAGGAGWAVEGEGEGEGEGAGAALAHAPVATGGVIAAPHLSGTAGARGRNGFSLFEVELGIDSADGPPHGATTCVRMSPSAAPARAGAGAACGADDANEVDLAGARKEGGADGDGGHSRSEARAASCDESEADQSSDDDGGCGGAGGEGGALGDGTNGPSDVAWLGLVLDSALLMLADPTLSVRVTMLQHMRALRALPPFAAPSWHAVLRALTHNDSARGFALDRRVTSALAMAIATAHADALQPTILYFACLFNCGSLPAHVAQAALAPAARGWRARARGGGGGNGGAPAAHVVHVLREWLRHGLPLAELPRGPLGFARPRDAGVDSVAASHAQNAALASLALPAALAACTAAGFAHGTEGGVAAKACAAVRDACAALGCRTADVFGAGGVHGVPRCALLSAAYLLAPAGPAGDVPLAPHWRHVRDALDQMGLCVTLDDSVLRYGRAALVAIVLALTTDGGEGDDTAAASAARGLGGALGVFAEPQPWPWPYRTRAQTLAALDALAAGAGAGGRIAESASSLVRDCAGAALDAVHVLRLQLVGGCASAVDGPPLTPLPAHCARASSAHDGRARRAPHAGVADERARASNCAAGVELLLELLAHACAAPAVAQPTAALLAELLERGLLGGLRAPLVARAARCARILVETAEAEAAGRTGARAAEARALTDALCAALARPLVLLTRAGERAARAAPPAGGAPPLEAACATHASAALASLCRGSARAARACARLGASADVLGQAADPSASPLARRGVEAARAPPLALRARALCDALRSLATHPDDAALEAAHSAEHADAHEARQPLTPAALRALLRAARAFNAAPSPVAAAGGSVLAPLGGSARARGSSAHERALTDVGYGSVLRRLLRACTAPPAGETGGGARDAARSGDGGGGARSEAAAVGAAARCMRDAASACLGELLRVDLDLLVDEAEAEASAEAAFASVAVGARARARGGAGASAGGELAASAASVSASLGGIGACALADAGSEPARARRGGAALGACAAVAAAREQEARLLLYGSSTSDGGGSDGGGGGADARAPREHPRGADSLDALLEHTLWRAVCELRLLALQPAASEFGGAADAASDGALLPLIASHALRTILAEPAAQSALLLTGRSGGARTGRRGPGGGGADADGGGPAAARECPSAREDAEALLLADLRSFAGFADWRRRALPQIAALSAPDADVDAAALTDAATWDGARLSGAGGGGAVAVAAAAADAAEARASVSDGEGGGPNGWVCTFVHALLCEGAGAAGSLYHCRVAARRSPALAELLLPAALACLLDADARVRGAGGETFTALAARHLTRLFGVCARVHPRVLSAHLRTLHALWSHFLRTRPPPPPAEPAPRAAAADAAGGASGGRAGSGGTGGSRAPRRASSGGLGASSGVGGVASAAAAAAASSAARPNCATAVLSLLQAVDLRRAVAGALAVGARCSAVQWLELHAVRGFELQPARVAADAEATRLLLRALSGSAEPDAIHGVSRSALQDDSHGWLATAVAHADWARVLTIYDSSLQDALLLAAAAAERGGARDDAAAGWAGRTADVPGADGARVLAARAAAPSGAVAISRLLGKAAACFADLGCASLARDVLRSQAHNGCAVELSAELRERAFESAWRLCSWGDTALAGTAGGGSGGSDGFGDGAGARDDAPPFALGASAVGARGGDVGGFNEGLHAALSALRVGRPDGDVARCLRACRRAVLRSLGATASEGGRALAVDLCHLQLLAEIAALTAVLARAGARASPSNDAAGAPAGLGGECTARGALRPLSDAALGSLGGAWARTARPLMMRPPPWADAAVSLRAAMLSLVGRPDALRPMALHACATARAAGQLSASARLVAIASDARTRAPTAYADGGGERGSAPGRAPGAVGAAGALLDACTEWERAQGLWASGGAHRRAAVAIGARLIVTLRARSECAHAGCPAAAGGDACAAALGAQADASFETSLALRLVLGRALQKSGVWLAKLQLARASAIEGGHLRAAVELLENATRDAEAVAERALGVDATAATAPLPPPPPPPPPPRGARAAATAAASPRAPGPAPRARSLASEQLRAAAVCAHFAYACHLDELERRAAAAARAGAPSAGAEQRAAWARASLASHTASLVTRARSEHDGTAVLRIASIWFEGAEAKRDARARGGVRALDAEQPVEQLLRAVPAWKLLPIVPQLGSRLGSGAPSDDALHAVLVRVALAHPHHVLPLLISLCNGHALSADERTATFAPDRAKLDAARRAIALIREGRPTARAMIDEYQLLAGAYLQLAWADAKPLVNALQLQGRPTRGPHRIDALPRAKPADSKAAGGGPPLLQLPMPFRHAAVLTAPLPVVPRDELDLRARATPDDNDVSAPDDDDDDGIVRVASFGGTFTTPGGINLPKAISCYGNDGRCYAQLVKGRDDLRQDAVMQQLFGRMNELLAMDTSARARRLALRTYRVVPLAPTAGVLEWVRGTLTMGSWLVDAHARWRPQDWAQKRCRERLAAEQPRKRSDAAILGAYREVCEHLRPVMHRWLVERWPDAPSWHEHRVTYTRSFAAASMAGYVVGLGDRHPSNVLLDEGTAEAVMIDLGIAFDQGKLLPTPERVPFRLTRDVVDGFGVCGVEGTFRRCAEATMHVLRRSSEQLLTLLQVLLHDPLFKWTLSPTLALRKQLDRAPPDEGGAVACAGGAPAAPRRPDGAAPGAPSEGGAEGALYLRDVAQFVGGAHEPAAGAGEKSVDAEHALLVVRQKLSGRAGGAVLSVEGQVRLLISQAMDERNLALMYPGWSPWL